jgi:hypothetical protein
VRYRVNVKLQIAHKLFSSVNVGVEQGVTEGATGPVFHRVCLKNNATSYAQSLQNNNNIPKLISGIAVVTNQQHAVNQETDRS